MDLCRRSPRASRAAISRLSSVVASRIAAIIDVDDLALVGALTLLTVGLWTLVGRSALIVPGVVGVWVTLPSRQPFIVRPSAPERADRKKKG
jgi:hypothetical protein